MVKNGIIINKIKHWEHFYNGLKDNRSGEGFACANTSKSTSVQEYLEVSLNTKVTCVVKNITKMQKKHEERLLCKSYISRFPCFSAYYYMYVRVNTCLFVYGMVQHLLVYYVVYVFCVVLHSWFRQYQ